MKEKDETVVVTRHPALVALLTEWGLIEAGTPVLAHVTPEMVRGKHVIGVLPLGLAAVAETVTEVPLALTPEMRGRELELGELREVAGEPVTYRIREVVDTPTREEQEITWSSEPGSRQRQSMLVLRTQRGRLIEFVGEHIPGVCAVLSGAFQKAGKWSGTTYRIRLAAGVKVAYSGKTGWNSGTLGEAIRATSWDEAADRLGVSREEAEEYIRRADERTAAEYDSRALACESLRSSKED